MIKFRKNIHILYDFFVAAKHKNLTKAARVNGVNESTICRSVKRLERLTMKKLIIPRSTGIELTRDGEKLYKELSVKFNG